MTTKDIIITIIVATLFLVSFIDIRHAEELRVRARNDHEKIVECFNWLFKEHQEIKKELQKCIKVVPEELRGKPIVMPTAMP